MKVLQITSLVLTVALLSIGQVLFKYASTKIDIDNDGLLSGIIFNPTVIFAVFIYGLATVCWMIVLTGVELRIAYPYAALAFLIVPVLSYFFLKEPISLNTFIGALIILVGVYVSSR